MFSLAVASTAAAQLPHPQENSGANARIGRGTWIEERPLSSPRVEVASAALGAPNTSSAFPPLGMAGGCFMPTATRAKDRVSGACGAHRSTSILASVGMLGPHPAIVAKGYRPDWFLADMQALRERFINEFGQPRWSIIHRQSMGGHVAVASLELHPGIYQGALIECGVVDGIGLMDWLYAYTAAAQYFSATPLLDTPRPDFDTLVTVAWPTVMGTPGHYTERGQRFDSVVKHLSGGEVPFRLEGMKQRYLQNLNPRQQNVRGAQKFARHADTRQVQYEIDPGYGVDAAVLNRDVPRVTASSDARSREANPVFAEMTGKIQVPLLTIHETGDFRVPFRLEPDYRRRALAAGTAHLLVQRAVRRAGHCGIEGTVRERAFDDLVAWVEHGIMPEGDDVLGDVAKLGLRWTPDLLPHDPARRP